MWPFSPKKIAPQNVQQQAVLAPNTRFNPSWKLTYEWTRQPDPGAMRYAYMNLGLVEYSPIGPGVSNRKQFISVQPRQGYAHFTAKLAGIGGLAQGTFYSAPLIATSRDTEGQIYG